MANSFEAVCLLWTLLIWPLCSDGATFAFWASVHRISFMWRIVKQVQFMHKSEFMACIKAVKYIPSSHTMPAIFRIRAFLKKWFTMVIALMAHKGHQPAHFGGNLICLGWKAFEKLLWVSLNGPREWSSSVQHEKKALFFHPYILFCEHHLLNDSWIFGILKLATLPDYGLWAHLVDRDSRGERIRRPPMTTEVFWRFPTTNLLHSEIASVDDTSFPRWERHRGTCSLAT